MKRSILLIAALALMISCNQTGKGPVMAENPSSQEMAGSPGRVTPDKVDVKVEKSEGTLSIAELLENRDSYKDKVVTVSGKITKINKAILGKNWLHLQDGTDYNGSYDLTITTTLEPSEGDVVTLTGRIVLNKDFGYGYFYDILMEDAIIAE